MFFSRTKKIILILSSIFLFVPIFWNSNASAGSEWFDALTEIGCGAGGGSCSFLKKSLDKAIEVAIDDFCQACENQDKQCKMGYKADTYVGVTFPQLKMSCELRETRTQTESILDDLQTRFPGFGKKPMLQINIPGLKFSNVMSTTDDTGTYFHIPWIPELISALYKFGIAIVSIVAVVMIIIQGMRIVTSGGGEAKQGAYKKILQSVIGLFIAWGSFAILYNINPELVQFKALKVKVVERVELSTENSGNVITDADIAAPKEGTNNVPLFKQFDFPNTPYGKCGTIKSSGCGPTSMAMVMKFYGIDIDPAKVAASFAQEGYRDCPTNNCNDCRGTSHSAFTKSSLLAQYGLKAEKVVIDEKKILELLKDNNPLIAAVGPQSKGITSYGTLESFTKGGHFIVITGIDANGNFLINDPGKAITVAKVNDLFAGLKGIWRVYGLIPPHLAPLGCCVIIDEPKKADTTYDECFDNPKMKDWIPGDCP